MNGATFGLIAIGMNHTFPMCLKIVSMIFFIFLICKMMAQGSWKESKSK